MNIILTVDNQVIIDMNLDTSLLPRLLQGCGGASVTQTVSKSTPMSKTQAQDLLSRIDEKSVIFLKQIAANNGTIAWGEMRKIFGIDDKEDTTSFTARYGKGITRALRNLLNNKSARLVWWNDEDWDWESKEPDTFEVYVDGPALQALREATEAS